MTVHFLFYVLQIELRYVSHLPSVRGQC